MTAGWSPCAAVCTQLFPYGFSTKGSASCASRYLTIFRLPLKDAKWSAENPCLFFVRRFTHSFNEWARIGWTRLEIKSSSRLNSLMSNSASEVDELLIYPMLKSFLLNSSLFVTWDFCRALTYYTSTYTASNESISDATCRGLLPWWSKSEVKSHSACFKCSLIRLTLGIMLDSALKMT